MENSPNQENSLLKHFLTILLLFIIIGSTGNIIFSIPIRQEKNQNDNLLVFMTYNIHFGIDSYGKYDPVKIAEVISSKHPDIVGIQEITKASAWNSYADLGTRLTLELEKRGYLYHVMDYKGAQSIHNAIFSKYPIVEEKVFYIEPVVRYQRTLIMTKINVNGTIIAVFNTHLTHIGKSTPERISQVENILSIINNLKLSIPIVLMGDFNSKPYYKEIQLILQNGFIDTWKQTNTSNSSGYTSPAINPYERIDYIFFKGLTPLSSFTIQTTASDHLPLITITTP